MIPDLDIYRAANLLIHRHGADAMIEASRLLGITLERGDHEGQLLWRRIKQAIVVLQAHVKQNGALGAALAAFRPSKTANIPFHTTPLRLAEPIARGWAA